jgi:hypothetical protein
MTVCIWFQVLYEVIAAFNLVAASSECRQESGSMKGMVSIFC